MIALCQSGTRASSERQIICDGPSRCSPFERHRSNAPFSQALAAPRIGLIDIRTSLLLLCLSISPLSTTTTTTSLSIFPSLFNVALRIKALLKDESRGPLQKKEEGELDPGNDGGEWWLEFESKKKRGKERRLDMWGENVADRTHFNKTVMTIVFPVRSAEIGLKELVVPDLSGDSTAAELGLQVPPGAATLLNYTTTKTFSLVELLQVHYDRCSFGKYQIFLLSLRFLLRDQLQSQGHGFVKSTPFHFSTNMMLHKHTHTHTHR